MSTKLAKLRYPVETTVSSSPTVHVGRIVGLTKNLCAIVDYPEKPQETVIARSTVSLPSTDNVESLIGRNVLIVFEKNNPTLPIIIGFVSDEIVNLDKQINNSNTINNPREIVIDSKRVVLDASEEIVLKCGPSTITLGANGKIIIKGAQIVSRASKTNKIKGATVNIN